MKSNATNRALALLLFAVSLQAAAEEPAQSYASTIGAKAGQGLLNTAAGWIEIPRTMVATSQRDGLGLGLSVGFFQGLANMLGRIGLGVTDMITFPIPTKPMVEPPTVWQNFGQETRFNNSWEMYETR